MYCDVITDGGSVHRLAYFADDAAKLVADDGRAARSSYRVFLGGREFRVTVLVEIEATDPTGLNVDSDVCRSDVAQCDVAVDSDILFSVETCSFHVYLTVAAHRHTPVLTTFSANEIYVSRNV